MIYGQLDPPLVPKDGQTLHVLVPVRVSDPTKQDERSLGDQRDKIEKWLRERTEYPFVLEVLEGRQSGELLDRKEYLLLISEVETRRYDCVISEDLGRIVRRIQAHLFCELCVDYNTRLIAINDNLDTAREGWQDTSIFSAWHHERSNRDTSMRIKRTQRSRFMQGGCLPCETYGYIRRPGAKSDADLQKDPSAEPIYKEWFRMLDQEDGTFADVARWLRRKGVPLPPHARNTVWDSRMVGRITLEGTVLKGVRERNRRKTRRVGSGKYTSIKAEPGELLQRKVPHLAFFEPSYYDRVVAKVMARNVHFRRSDRPVDDPCLHRSRKDTRYPGRVTVCGICGRGFVWGGHGQSDRLMCTGARTHQCWNGVSFDGPIAAARIAQAMLSEAQQLAEFDPAFLDMVNQEAGRLDLHREQKILDLQHQVTEVTRGIARILAFVGKMDGDPPASLGEELQRLEREKSRLKGELIEIEHTPIHRIQIPPAGELRRLAQSCLKDFAPHSSEFARVMRKLVPRILVFPYRLCDGGALVLRATFRLELGNLLTDPRAAGALRQPLLRTVTVNLFDPPQREAFRERIVLARAQGMTERQAADQWGLTVTAAQAASVLQRTMNKRGLTDAYVPVQEPLDDCPKRRRHKSVDYSFEPLDGAGIL